MRCFVAEAVVALVALAGCSSSMHTSSAVPNTTTPSSGTAGVAALPPVEVGPQRAHSCSVAIAWHSPRYSNRYARFVMRVRSNDPGSLSAQIRELDNGHSFGWTGATDSSGYFRLTDAIGPNVVGRSEVLIRIHGRQSARCARQTILPS